MPNPDRGSEAAPLRARNSSSGDPAGGGTPALVPAAEPLLRHSTRSPGAPLATLDAIFAAAGALGRAATRIQARAERRSAPVAWDWAKAAADLAAAEAACRDLRELLGDG